ncbi:SUN domain-containing protein 2 isoform X2 [Larimichthys crocea]|uniref:SUN domain-containing protein 2 isoform X2 n=1 Tax=Larimichthys crocea TaxID=215358 RepID=UPI000F5D9596|nr:SUN domain-containing protein 2 isoform X2 [Larimichthys crocea]
MSRRSLRLDDGLLDRSLPHGSASFSVGGTSWRSTRSLKSRRSQQLSVSCSESLLLSTPRKLAGPLLLDSSLHSIASDASLLSSVLDDSSVQETTLVDTFWGLDQDVDPKESTIIAEHSTILADRTLIGSDDRCPKHLVQTLSRVYCQDCELHSDRKESTQCTSSRYTTSSSVTGTGPSGPEEPETSTIYCRHRKSRTGVLASAWDRSAACVMSLLTLLHQLTLQKHHDVTDVLQLWLDSGLLCVSTAAARCVSVLTHLATKLPQVNRQTDTHGARSSHCGVMDLRESTTDQEELHPTGPLCDDCKDKQHSETDTVTSSPSGPSPSSVWSSVASRVLVLTWTAAVFTASCLFELTLSAASALWPLTKTLCSSSVSAGRSAGKKAADLYRWLHRRWHHVTPGSLLTRAPLRLLLVLLPLLLLLSLSWFGPAGLWSVLPVVNITEWSTAVSEAPGTSSDYDSVSFQSQSADGAVESRELQPYEEPIYSRPPPAETPSGAEEAPVAADESMEAARLVRLEHRLTALWERVEASGQQAEQRHREVLQLYTDLQQQQSSARSGGDEAWLSGLMAQQLRTRLDEDRRQREQTRQQDLWQQQNQASRLEQLELQLQALAANTEEEQQRRGAAVSPSSPLPAAVSVGVDRQSHDALLAEVARLEAALQDVRRDVEGLSGCRDGCSRLDRIQQTISEQVSAQVHEEVRTLFYGNQLTVRDGSSGDAVGLPESLLRWLSQRYVSGADLQAALASMELSILQNVSLQLDQRRAPVREAVLQAAVSEEDVHVIVKNALRIFSQDRTGLADYALESGGGSILSTRCSETYETKAALLSLFGVPLWYFSQSPRAVIQPDVHPGNCWAFRGSAGFLVIRLSMRVVPSAFSLEHVPKALAPSGTLHSAPRDFSVYGLDDESQVTGTLLGSFTYDEDGEALQTFSVTVSEEDSDLSFHIIEVQILSNWGHQDYTCMYRFRVHGTPEDAGGRPETPEDAGAGGRPETPEVV